MSFWPEGVTQVPYGNSAPLLGRLGQCTDKRWPSDTTMGTHPVGELRLPKLVRIAPLVPTWSPTSLNLMDKKRKRASDPLPPLGIVHYMITLDEVSGSLWTAWRVPSLGESRTGTSYISPVKPLLRVPPWRQQEHAWASLMWRGAVSAALRISLLAERCLLLT